MIYDISSTEFSLGPHLLIAWEQVQEPWKVEPAMHQMVHMQW
jgi:hypothetical protein